MEEGILSHDMEEDILSHDDMIFDLVVYLIIKKQKAQTRE